jgi:CelD/BcsL family acetyltransferase involved in cellulose biosynthesis
MRAGTIGNRICVPAGLPSKFTAKKENQVDVQEISSFEALAGQAADWTRIADNSPHATVFQTWEWTRAWWRHQGAGKRLWALVFRENGIVVGFAALFLPLLPTPLRTVRFVGNGGSDYLDILAAPGFETSVADAFHTFLWERRGAGTGSICSR